MAAVILVTGVTGNIGSAVAKHLLAKGYQVRGLVSNEKQIARVPEGVVIAYGDLDKPDTLHDAFKGVGGAFLLPGFADMPSIYTIAKAAGVTHVVQLSGRSAETKDMTNAVTAYMVQSEDAARESGIPWTIIRPSAYMTNTFRWAEQLKKGDVIRLPFADNHSAMIDPDDIGNVIATIFTEPEKHTDKAYSLSGPEALAPADCVRIIGEVLHRDLQFQAQPNDEAREEMLQTTPQKYVDAFFDFYVHGALDESPILPTVQEITGKQPRDYRSWAEAHAADLG
jgi:uncharacterized protein YbjT (DUF2867 family)